MDTKVVSAWALVLLIAIVLAVTIRHARRAEREITPSPRKARRSRAVTARQTLADPPGSRTDPVDAVPAPDL